MRASRTTGLGDEVRFPAGGYQAAAEERWAYDGAVISAIFRDTTLQAFEGCLFGPATGWCGLHRQLLVRIGPPDGGADPSPWPWVTRLIQRRRHSAVAGRVTRLDQTQPASGSLSQ